MAAANPSFTSRLLGADFSWRLLLRTDRLTWISRALSLTGFAIAALPDDGVPGRHSTCVRDRHRLHDRPHSTYANIAGIPVPVIGLCGYTTLFITACLPGQRARTAGMVFTMLAISASAVLTYLELNVIHAICIWCVASAACALLHVIVNSARYVRGEPNLPSSSPVMVASCRRAGVPECRLDRDSAVCLKTVK